MKRNPNIVLILADDMGYSDIGCYGGEIETPNIDSLAKNGLRFSRFYNTGRCCPSRASLLTGLYPHQAGIGDMLTPTDQPGYSDLLSQEAVTLAEVLRTAGYRTMMTGKWHIGWKDEGSPPARGFDRFYGTRGYIDSYYTTVPRTEMYLDNRQVIGVTEKPVNHLHPDREWYTTDVFTDYALHFMEEAKEKGAPFFLYLAYNAPHFPLHAKPEDLKKYRGRYREKGWNRVRQERYQRLAQSGLFEQPVPLSDRDSPDWNTLPNAIKDEMDLKMALYAAIVDRLDQNVGRVIAHLKAAGEFENTLILFLSDNGGTREGNMFGLNGHENNASTYPKWARAGGWTSSYGQAWANVSNTPFRRYKRENHEGGISTPLIAHWPEGLRARGITHQVGHLIDVMPTLVEVSGATYPRRFNGRDIQPMEGRSLLPTLRGAKPVPRTLFWEHEGNAAVRVSDEKLTRLGAKAPWELYDMKSDRSELRDLSGQRPEKVKEMVALWDAWATRARVLPKGNREL